MWSAKSKTFAQIVAENIAKSKDNEKVPSLNNAPPSNGHGQVQIMPKKSVLPDQAGGGRGRGDLKSGPGHVPELIKVKEEPGTTKNSNGTGIIKTKTAARCNGNGVNHNKNEKNTLEPTIEEKPQQLRPDEQKEKTTSAPIPNNKPKIVEIETEIFPVSWSAEFINSTDLIDCVDGLLVAAKGKDIIQSLQIHRSSTGFKVEGVLCELQRKKQEDGGGKDMEL